MFAWATRMWVCFKNIRFRFFPLRSLQTSFKWIYIYGSIVTAALLWIHPLHALSLRTRTRTSHYTRFLWRRYAFNVRISAHLIEEKKIVIHAKPIYLILILFDFFFVLVFIISSSFRHIRNNLMLDNANAMSTPSVSIAAKKLSILLQQNGNMAHQPDPFTAQILNTWLETHLPVSYVWCRQSTWRLCRSVVIVRSLSIWSRR